MYTFLIDESYIDIVEKKYVIICSVKLNNDFDSIEQKIRKLVQAIKSRPEFQFGNRPLAKRKDQHRCFHFHDDHYILRGFVLFKILLDITSFEVGYALIPEQKFKQDIPRFFAKTVWLGNKQERSSAKIIIEKASEYKENDIKAHLQNVEIAPKCKYASLAIADYLAGIMREYLEYKKRNPLFDERASEKYAWVIMQSLAPSIKIIKTPGAALSHDSQGIKKFLRNPLCYIIE